MDEKNNKISNTEMGSNNRIRSKSTIKYSSVSTSPNFVRLQCNTNLNLPPSKWLSDEAESYGLRHTFSSGYTSLQIANMFPGKIGGVDVVSDAENIKNLLKMTYCNKSISMMVHRVDHALLIDEFDVHKHLMIQKNGDWEWMRNFFYSHVIKSLEKKEKYITCKVNTFNVLQQKDLYSKFLHHSIADSLNSNQIIKQNVIKQPLPSGPSLSVPNPEEAFPDDPNTHQLFNHYVSWHFEYIKMLLGTNVPIFRSDQSSSSFFSSKLRNISKPLSVSTAIDYWLDNLFCNIPEVVICYHLNGFVQKYESVNTEHLPVLNNSNFSVEVIKNVAQNLILFLKANTSTSGHTYWLFKGKNEDEIKLYDLTSICFESSAYECSEGRNPLTVPVAMLSYRVAQTLNYNPTQEKQINPASVQNLLDTCLKMLNKTMYPQLVTSIHYILSDVYISQKFKPESPKFFDITHLEEDFVGSNDNWSFVSDIEKFACCVNLNNLLLPQDNKGASKKYKERIKFNERCQKALYHIACGLRCLENFKNGDLQNTCEGESMAKENTNIDALVDTEYGISSEVKTNKKVINNDIKNKNRKHNIQDIATDLDDFNIIFRSEGIFYRSIFENDLSWLKPSDPNNSELWKHHLRVLFYKKASLSYVALAEYEFSCKRYGRALKYFYYSYECQMIICNNNPSSIIRGFLFARLGDCRYNMALNWEHILQYENEIETDEEFNLNIWELLKGEHDCSNDALEVDLNSREGMLQTAECDFLLSLKCLSNEKLCINNVHHHLNQIYIAYVHALISKSLQLSPLEIEFLLKKIRRNSFVITEQYAKFNRQASIVHNYRITASVHRDTGYFLKTKQNFNGKCMNAHDYINISIEYYQKALTLMGSRAFDKNMWDDIYWELSEIIYHRAIDYQNKLILSSDPADNKEVINLLLEVLKYCDVVNVSKYQSAYQFRNAYIHQRLAYFYLCRLRSVEENTRQFRNSINQYILHCDSAFDGFLEINHLLDCLETIQYRLIFEMHLFENTETFKVKSILYIIEALKKCVLIFPRILINDYTKNVKIDIHEDTTGCSIRKRKLLIDLETRLQYILKSLIKQAMLKPSKLTDKLNILKTIYSDLLRKNDDIDIGAHILRIITQITELRL